MTPRNRAHLLSERKRLQQMIAATTPDAALNLRSLRLRLATVDAELALAGPLQREGAKARLTFSGRPVVGSHGIFADFGTKAVSGFAEAVAAVAASLQGVLQAMGPIPNRDMSQLLITNTALGSFGFELEEHVGDQLPLDHAEQSIVFKALSTTHALLLSTVTADNNALAEAASELDIRALRKVRTFVQTLADHEALVSFEFENRLVRLSSAPQLARALEALSDDNVQEEVVTLNGQFEGALPGSRTFEFRIAGGELISGKVSREAGDVGVLNHHLYVRTDIRVRRTQVGTGRPRYVLIEAPWQDAPAQLPPA